MQCTFLKTIVGLRKLFLNTPVKLQEIDLNRSLLDEQIIGKLSVRKTTVMTSYPDKKCCRQYCHVFGKQFKDKTDLDPT